MDTSYLNIELDLDTLLAFLLGFGGSYLLSKRQRTWAKEDKEKADHKQAISQLRAFIIKYKDQLDFYMKSAGMRTHTMNSLLRDPSKEWSDLDKVSNQFKNESLLKQDFLKEDTMQIVKNINEQFSKIWHHLDASTFKPLLGESDKVERKLESIEQNLDKLK